MDHAPSRDCQHRNFGNYLSTGFSTRWKNRKSDFHKWNKVVDAKTETSINLRHFPSLIILERLLDFRAAVHYERSLADNWLGDWFAVHHQKLCIGLCLHGETVAGASKDCQVASLVSLSSFATI